MGTAARKPPETIFGSPTVPLLAAVAVATALLLVEPGDDPLVLPLALGVVAVLVVIAVAQEVARRRACADLVTLALRDPVTGIANRRVFDDALTRALERCRDTGEPVTVVLVDIDSFKQVNDEHGHTTGDAVLCAVADALAREIRGRDIVTRWGGDEFAVVLPGTSVADAGPVAVRLCTAMAASVSSPAISLSMGWATAPEHGLDAGVLLKAADETLYAAKRSRDIARAAKRADHGLLPVTS